MKQIEKKDRPKLIAIGVVALAIFGFVGWQAMAGMFETPQAAPATAQNGASAVGAGKAGEASGDLAAFAPPKSLGDVFVGKDPFLPSGPAAPKDLTDSNAAAPPPPPPTVTPVAGTRVLRNPSMNAILRPFMPSAASLAKLRQQRGIGALLDGQGAARGGAAFLPKPVVVPPPPPPVYTMTGVIMAGEEGQPLQPIAVLRGQATGTNGGADDRRFVRVGDMVGNGYYVATINRSGVLLRIKGDKRAKPARIPLGALPGAMTAASANSPVPVPGRTSNNIPVVPAETGAPSVPVTTPATATKSGNNTAAPSPGNRNLSIAN